LRKRLIRLAFHLSCLVTLPITRALFRVSVQGPRRLPPGPLIIAPNHASWVDPVVVQHAIYPRRLTFLMADIYYNLPVAGLYFRAIGARPVREDAPSVGTMRAALQALKDGDAVCVFPEGEITHTGAMGEGERGVALLARRSGAPVVPVGIRGAIHVLSRVQRTPRVHPISVHIGEALRYEEPKSRDGEAAYLRRLMASIRNLAYGGSSSLASSRGRRIR
jgi:1-acyl-sn-glycerol-3-phosphate acyltransferase